MSVSWIVVADSANARIFMTDRHGAHWQEITDLIHAESRMSATELETDRPGRSYDSKGMGRHAMEPKQTRKMKESGIFATQISDYLKQHDKEFEELVLVCAPRFLGQLRKQLDKSASKKVSREISRDVVHAKQDKIQSLVSSR